jgi:DNA polymerase (family 10)
VTAQQNEIDKLNKRLGQNFHVFKGIESDILGDGSLDYPDDILQTFDFVIASVHSKFRMSEKEQTDRIVTAIGNPSLPFLATSPDASFCDVRVQRSI